MTVVISQPMFLPWIGLFEQIRLADVYVHYDDVQMPQGRSFMSRVQIKTSDGVFWLTAPVQKHESGCNINQVKLNTELSWRQKHLKTLQHNYRRAKYFDDMYSLALNIYDFGGDGLAKFNQNAIEVIARWLGFKTKFLVSSELNIPGKSTERLVSICQKLEATKYVTGLGALRYMNYDCFEDQKISVEYMDYKKINYLQMYGDFTPFVSILDSIAYCGHEVEKIICSNSIYWRSFKHDVK